MRLYSNISKDLPGAMPAHRSLIYHAYNTVRRIKHMEGTDHCYSLVGPGWESAWALHIPLPFKRTESQDYGRVKIRGWASFKIATMQSDEGYSRRWMFGLCVPRIDPVAFEKPDHV